MWLYGRFLVIAALPFFVSALRYSSDHVGYNLNENQTAVDPLDYWGEWSNHTYHPSPSNWRLPMYTFFLDRFVNGDPTNDNANGTQFEHDILSTQLRYGGDVKGLQDTLDYIQGMGVKLLYIVGSPFLNMPWGGDGYSPLDLTLLDRHHGDILAWRSVIDDIHSRGMYVIFENTFATMGDLMGFEGYLNQSTPFAANEHNVIWKGARRYHDFTQSDLELDQCEYPRFWGADGKPVTNTSHLLVGCRDSEFDQYGEVASFGDYPEWQRQISKFAFVQDRLREWRPSVLAKIQHFSCMTIASLDIDGFRIDKALQVTVDAQGSWSSYIRQCAQRYNKTNFYIPGEIVSGNSFGSIYIGRGMEPQGKTDNLTEIVTVNNNTNREYIRDLNMSALDGAAFHYTIYRALTRFLGMDGIYEAEGDPPVNFVETWNALLQTNDMVNAYTGDFDPRHMFGISNQDVFRWPGIENGTEKNILGLFIITLLFPGIPTLLWGEEQAAYVLESTNANYVFGRPPMSSSQAWQMHGCYKVGSVKYANFPVSSATYGCEDDNISLDHRDPSHPVRNIVKRMFEMREHYPTLNDGFYLQQMSNHTYNVYLPGSNGVATETGLWSVYRSGFRNVQNFTGIGQGDQSVWLLFTNENSTVDYDFDCNGVTGLLSPFVEGVTVKNLFAPYEEYTLERGSVSLGLEGASGFNGCLPNLSMQPWGFKALVPKDKFVLPRPALTAFYPGHDHRMWSNNDRADTLHIKFGFSREMDCDSISQSLQISSTVTEGNDAVLDKNSVSCSAMNYTPKWAGEPATTFVYEADLINLYHGVHEITVNNASGSDRSGTNSVDKVLIRIGAFNNPMVYPKTGNYSDSLLFKHNDGDLYVSHHAAGADLWRYSLNFGTTYSDWLPYTGGNSTLSRQPWSGTKQQAWEGEHVIVQYWSQKTGSSDHYQHGDVGWSQPRRFPNLWLEGAFNQYGYDAGLANQMSLGSNSTWSINFNAEWPTGVLLSAWGVNPDSSPDVTQVFGDIDGDGVLDRIPEQSLLRNVINLTDAPPSPFLSYRLEVNDGSFQYRLIPVGSRWMQLSLYLLLALVPFLTAVGTTLVYANSFYQVKFNEFGVTNRATPFLQFLSPKIYGFQWLDNDAPESEARKKSGKGTTHSLTKGRSTSAALSRSAVNVSNVFPQTVTDAIIPPRRRVLIATMEYDIEDWNIKIKIGGLGVMATLMGKNLGHQDLIWVVPCVGGVDYPEIAGELASPMKITVYGQQYQIQVRMHVLRNITYVLLDAPIFRKQTKAEPYPPRMDDLDSAIYYSAWNSCIAEGIRRYKPDLYHINDYHGCVAPLHLLPDTVPCALSLHNAEFQGLWPMRTKQEKEEVCKIYNLDPEIVSEYVQFGEVFNLLHAGASYLRRHQKSFGAVGVSKKYGKRSYARYPILWGLYDVGALPNPDPEDVAEWERSENNGTVDSPAIDPEFEASRASLRIEAQKWANLNIDGSAELFVFVGRWSMQKGVDLIADVFPAILDKHPKSQLICIGPVIDLYGRFAAIKLDKMMKVYPGRVFSKPEFTALPPYIFSGAEFALIPSRDEPFGLVAVEFGRKGALGVGARVGGLGQMPGWWYTIESTSTKHLLQQFRGAIEGAIASRSESRAVLRARSQQQRFPVLQWVQDLETLQSTAIKKHQKYGSRHKRRLQVVSMKSYNAMADTTSKVNRDPDVEVSVPNSGLQRSVHTSGESHSSHSENMVDQPGDPEVRHKSNTGNMSGLQRMSSRLGPGHTEPRNSVQLDHDSLLEDSEDRFFDARSVLEPSYGCAHQQQGQQSTIEQEQEFSARISSSFAASQFQLSLALQSNESDWVAEPPRALLSPSDSPGMGSPNMMPGTPRGEPMGGGEFPGLSLPFHSSDPPRYSTLLSNGAVVGERKDFKLQQVDPFFTDSQHDYRRAFEQRLSKLDGKSSQNTIIEEFIVKSEKDWFDRLRGVRMGKTMTPVGSIFRDKDGFSPVPLVHTRDSDAEDEDDLAGRGQFLLADDYKPPTGLKRFLLHRVGDWPLYSILLALGQVIAANSYQITLLTGGVGQSPQKLYTVASIYLLTSIMWWAVYRTLKSVWVLSLPFFFYGSAFLLVGFSPYANGLVSRGWVQNVASACYSVASSSGSLFFALNFGDQGGTPVKSWVFRAGVIQGIQQVYIALLWCWGATLVRLSDAGLGSTSSLVTDTAFVSSIGIVVAILMWTVGIVIFFGLPDYYRQAPGMVPSFIPSILRRRIVLWFFMMVVIQNFFLSTPYGRNWLYLWSSKHLTAWMVALLVAVFFVGIWSMLLYIASVYSKSHSWLLPIFAIGIFPARYCQIGWGVSGIGQYLPWAGSAVVSAFCGRSLWLWLGVLDSIQNVGFGQILLHTLTRFHIAFTLIVAQVLGSVATIAARAFGPSRLGPGPVFPDFSAGILDGLQNAWFWIGLLTQISINLVALFYFRKEQLSKP